MIIVPLIQTILKSSLKHRNKKHNNYRDWETQSTEAANTGKIQIVDYSNKAIAVIGDTKPIKELIMDLDTPSPLQLLRKLSNGHLKQMRQSLRVKRGR